MEMTMNPIEPSDNSQDKPPTPEPVVETSSGTAVTTEYAEPPIEPPATAVEPWPEMPASLTSDLPPLPPQEEPQPTMQPEPREPPAEPLAEQVTDLPTVASMPNAAQMELDKPTPDTIPKESLDTKKIGKTVGVVLLVLAVGLLIKANSGTLGSQKTKGKGYSYSFRFYRHSKLFTYGDGTTALKHAIDDTIGSVKPTTTADLKTCSKVGNGWKEVFNANINGASVPVCTPDSKTYIAVFPAAGHEQLFTVAYNTVQKSDTYPLLTHIFESVSVKK